MLVYELGDRKMNLKISAERGDGMLNYLEQGMIQQICSKPLLQKFDSTI